MCEYCEDEKIMMVQYVIDRSKWAWGYDPMIKLTLAEAEEDQNKLGVFIDRGHLRMVELHDCNCMDNGMKLKINFCPMCGEKINAD